MCYKFIISWNLKLEPLKFIRYLFRNNALQFPRPVVQNSDIYQFVVIVQVNDGKIHSMDVFDDQALVDQF